MKAHFFCYSHLRDFPLDAFGVELNNKKYCKQCAEPMKKTAGERKKESVEKELVEKVTKPKASTSQEQHARALKARHDAINEAREDRLINGNHLDI